MNLTLRRKKQLALIASFLFSRDDGAPETYTTLFFFFSFSRNRRDPVAISSGD